MQRRHHYEQAFEAYLRRRRIPYLGVHEARKALVPVGGGVRPAAGEGSLKNFDFVIYGDGLSLLVEVKGRRMLPRQEGGGPGWGRGGPRLECWTTRDDIESLGAWERLFGAGFEAVLVFVYWCEETPPDGVFEEVFEHGSRRYGLRVVRVREYRGLMRARSAAWRTVDVSPADFGRISGALAPAGACGSGQSVGWTGGGGLGESLPALPRLESVAGLYGEGRSGLSCGL